MRLPGRFLSFEGLDGSGKSTQLARLAHRLRAQGREVVTTAEPGGTAIGLRIREILLSPDHQGLDPRAELLLYFAARAQNLSQIILPGLARGAMVLADRYTDSTIAYQGAARGLGESTVRTLHSLACQDIWPETTLLFDLDVPTAQSRSQSRGPADRMEGNDQEFFHQVRNRYVELALEEPNRIRLVKALGTPDETETLVWEALHGRI